MRSKKRETVGIDTVNHSGLAEVETVKDLKVRGSEEFGEYYTLMEINLPDTFSRERIPIDRDDVPTAEALREWEYLEDVVRTMPGVKDIPLGLLIGGDCPKALEPVEVIPSQGDGPYAKRTRLGWCVSAADREEASVRLKCNTVRVLETRIKNVSIDKALQEMWKAEFIEKESEKKALSKEDRMFLSEMREPIQFEDGHYVLPLPLRKQKASPTGKKTESNSNRDRLLQYAHGDNPNMCPEDVDSEVDQIKNEQGYQVSTDHIQKDLKQLPEEVSCRNKVKIVSEEEVKLLETKDSQDSNSIVVMPENRSQILHRLKYTRKKMLKEPKFYIEYCNFMRKLFKANHARKVPKERIGERAWYIPHHGVYHPTKGKLRVVFDCSAEKDGVSLNSKLKQGPDFSNSLLGVLIRFRLGLIPVMADIESMYHQVKIPDEHCKFLRFFWWEDGNLDKEPVECEMCVHPFGAISSKNCVSYALHQTGFDNKEEFGEEAMQTLLRDFYVDDLLKAIDDEGEAVELISRIIHMCSAGGFNLTKFLCPWPKVLSGIPIVKRAEILKGHIVGSSLPSENALGVLWNMEDDSFGFQVNFDADDGTRKGCLSTISRIHDPPGLAAPFLLPGKKILQLMTNKSVGWDEKLRPDDAEAWERWREDMLLLNK